MTISSIKLAKSIIHTNILSGEYIPKNGEHFRVSSDISQIYEKADLIVSHGGAGTLLQNLHNNKVIIAVANDSLQGNHQV